MPSVQIAVFRVHAGARGFDMKLEVPLNLSKWCLGCIFVQFLNSYDKRLFCSYNLRLSDAAATGWVTYTYSFLVLIFKEQVGGIPILDFKYNKYNNQVYNN